jgi:hypothetical protein
MSISRIAEIYFKSKGEITTSAFLFYDAQAVGICGLIGLICIFVREKFRVIKR